MIHNPLNARIHFPNDNEFIFKEIDIKSFIYAPERLWKICLDNRDQVVLFFVCLQNQMEWEQYRRKIIDIIKGRTIEFSTLFLFLDDSEHIFIATYMSSKYKACRVFYPHRFPFKIDKRYLKGLQSTYDISLNDHRNTGHNDIYFQRVQRLVDYISRSS